MFESWNVLAIAFFDWRESQIPEVKAHYWSEVIEVKDSRTHFEVLGLGFEGQGLGLEASSPRKIFCPRLKDSTIFFERLKCSWKTPETSRNIREDFFCFSLLEITWKIFLKTFLFVLFFWRSPEKFSWKTFFLITLAPVSLSIPLWPRIYFVS